MLAGVEEASWAVEERLSALFRSLALRSSCCSAMATLQLSQCYGDLGYILVSWTGGQCRNNASLAYLGDA